MYKIPIINSLRGLAAIMVCMYHYVYTTQNFIENELILDIFSHGKYGVQVFFIISGIVIPLSMIKSEYKYNRFSKFIIKRFIRIEPPYIIAVILGILYLNLRNYIPGTATLDLAPTLKDTLLHLGYLIPFFEDSKWISPVFWTLSVEFQYYLILALTIPLILNSRIIFRLLFYSILLGLPFIINNSSFFPAWASFFGLGIIYAFHFVERISHIEFFSLLFLFMLSVFISLGPINLFIGITTLLVIHFFKDFNPKFGVFFGKISYSLYLTHSIFGKPVINFLSHRFHEPYQKLLIISLGFSISVLAAYMLWKLVEKPTQKLSRKY